ncbi:MAG: ribosome recycling factor [Deltaproteobacteria bacterium RIFCSPLOWO2_02_FULL_44_10]|nr:MAG: ribosome recycling factor [Deltaproteobacteria bacterium RIFCSPHIGHO2_02_FULL_44_16]OGQ46399.1 MAG: ribosome recycling factor [Deltaproteobacteria bacterium RIFCSPLOWO2_02_FULL_44_10]
MNNQVFNTTRERMEKGLTALRNELGKVRTGRASLSILHDIRADYYGSLSPLNQIATLGVPDARTITIQPWDPGAIPAIEKSIQASGLGLSPSNDGKLVRISIPALNEERRKELVKLTKKHAEEAKVSIRNARRDGNEQLKKMQKESAITEDEFRKSEEQIQKMTDDYIKKIDEAILLKEKDILEV